MSINNKIKISLRDTEVIKSSVLTSTDGFTFLRMDFSEPLSNFIHPSSMDMEPHLNFKNAIMLPAKDLKDLQALRALTIKLKEENEELSRKIEKQNIVTQDSISKPQEKMDEAIKILQNSDEKLASELLTAKTEINEEVVKYLRRHPHYISELPSRKFEQLIAEILSDMKYDVSLTKQTRDGGVDILAVSKQPEGAEILTVVECKRNASVRPIGIDCVERFLFNVKDKFKASRGMIVTTSRFSNDAKKLEQSYKWNLTLKDFGDIKDWLSQYGKWDIDSETGLYIPNHNQKSLM